MNGSKPVPPQGFKHELLQTLYEHFHDLGYRVGLMPQKAAFLCGLIADEYDIRVRVTVVGDEYLLLTQLIGDAVSDWGYINLSSPDSIAQLEEWISGHTAGSAP